MMIVMWVILPIVVAAGSGLLAYIVTSARMEVALATERQAIAGIKARLEAERIAVEQSMRATEETARRKALDDFLGDIRVEERHYVREHKVLFLHRRMLVMQERVFFRNIPLSSWVEHEVSLEEGADIEKLAHGLSVFGGDMLQNPEGVARRLLR